MSLDIVLHNSSQASMDLVKLLADHAPVYYMPSLHITKFMNVSFADT